jgi:5-methylcytosine-specific restriction endonuclease McrA
MREARTWFDEDLIAAVTSAKNMSDVLRTLGMCTKGGNHKTMKRHILRLGLDVSHFQPNVARNKALAEGRAKVKLFPGDVFVENGPENVGRYVKRFSSLEYKCEQCDNLGEHNGKPLSLQIDHRNGVRNDNRIENLRYLCPNCHSQTDTFAGRAARQYKIRPKKQRVSQKKVPYELLCAKFEELGTYVAVASEFGVSDVTVRKAVRCSQISLA